jgi:hypothetical protein
MQTGNLTGIEALCRRHWPELFEREPIVNGNNFGAAPDVAWLYLQRGERAHANRLLDLTLGVIRDPDERNIDPPEWSIAITEVEALALRGHKTEALAALRRAVDAGWRIGWWQVEIDPTLESISGEPEFAALLDEVKADLAHQLERIRTLEHNGEIDGKPAFAATLAR